MQLPLPERSVADTDSFPVAPDGVADWLSSLDPLGNERDAREVLRGLTHSNRLHNHVERRRAVVARFIPTLRALHERLADTARAQPLPLTSEFSRAAELAIALLREEALAYRLLMADSENPAADDARRGMLALTRRAELLLAGYRTLPDTLFAEAHALFRFARHHGLADEHRPADTAPESEPTTLAELYRYLLLLPLIDAQRHRVRQLPLLLDWLREQAACVQISVDNRRAGEVRAGGYAVDLQQSGTPVPSGTLLPGEPGSLLALDIRPLMQRTEQQLDGMQQTRASLLGADTLERQTLTRLLLTLGRSRSRRHGRRRKDTPTDPTFGLQEICARLRFGTDDDIDPASGWRLRDASVAGLQLQHAAAPAGCVQVGELVALASGPAPSSGVERSGTRRDISIAVVRRMRATADASMTIGVEFLARSVMPVSLHREDDPHSAPEHGLVIACRIGARSVQSVLVPPFLFRAGDRLRIGQGGRSRGVELTRCLQLNGLFSHYELGSTRKDG